MILQSQSSLRYSDWLILQSRYWGVGTRRQPRSWPSWVGSWSPTRGRRCGWWSSTWSRGWASPWSGGTPPSSPVPMWTGMWTSPRRRGRGRGRPPGWLVEGKYCDIFMWCRDCWGWGVRDGSLRGSGGPSGSQSCAGARRRGNGGSYFNEDLNWWFL